MSNPLPMKNFLLELAFILYRRNQIPLNVIKFRNRKQCIEHFLLRTRSFGVRIRKRRKLTPSVWAATNPSQSDISLNIFIQITEKILKCLFYWWKHQKDFFNLIFFLRYLKFFSCEFKNFRTFLLWVCQIHSQLIWIHRCSSSTIKSQTVQRKNC